jgi:phosphatidylinositol alpha-1,6-mannosyltransferase
LKRILIISTEFPPGPGGIGHHAYSLATSLSQHVECLQVISPGDYSSDSSVAQFDRIQPFKITRYKRSGKLLTYLRRIVDSYSIIRNEKISTIFFTGKFSLWQCRILKFTGLKFQSIIILHGSEVNLANPLLRWFTHKSIASADIVVSVSKFTQSLIPHNILISIKTVVIPNGVFPLNEINISHYPMEGSPLLLTVGHVSRRKGQHQVIKSLPSLIREFPALKYHVIGRPILVDEFMELAISLGVQDHVVFHGIIESHDELLSIYKRADVFMLLSENLPNGDVEGFGIVALEANLNGIPVVGSIGTGVEDAIKEGYSGYLVNSKDSEEVLKAVVQCVNHKKRLKESSIIWAKDHYWDNLVYHFLNLIE